MIRESEAAITLSNLTKRYGATCAVRGLSLRVPHGAIYGFLGPNGAGKTTTIRILLGLARPSSGRAEVLGFDVVRARTEIATRVGAVVESPAFYDYLTGMENLQVLALTAGTSPPRSKLAALLERVGLEAAGGRRVRGYSLGMRQRLGLASALVTDPQVLFLDEPANGLDPAGTVEMRALLRELAAEGRTVFLTSHLLSEVEQVCTHVGVLQSGSLKAEGPVEELLARPASLRVRVGSPRIAAETLAGAGVSATLDSDESLLVTPGPAGAPPIIRALVSAGIDVFEVIQQQHTLEQVFLELTASEHEPPPGEVDP